MISPDSSLILIIICSLICLGPLLASNVSCINSFLFLLALVLCFFFPNLLCSAYSTLSFSLLFAFCRNSFLSLCKLSISESSSLFLDCEDFREWFFRVSVNCQDFVHFLYSWFFIFQNIKCFFNSHLKGVANFSNILRSNLSGSCFWIFLSLINFLFISTLALTILWPLIISTLNMTSQFPTIFPSEDFQVHVFR